MRSLSLKVVVAMVALLSAAPVTAQSALQARANELHRIVDGGRNDITFRLSADSLLIGSSLLPGVYRVVPLSDVDVVVLRDSHVVALRCRDGKTCVIGRANGEEGMRDVEERLFAGRYAMCTCPSADGPVRCLQTQPDTVRLDVTARSATALLEVAAAMGEEAEAAAAARDLAAVRNWVVLNSRPPNEVAVARGAADGAFRLGWLRTSRAETTDAQGLRLDATVQLLRVDCARNAAQPLRMMALLQGRVVQQRPAVSAPWQPATDPVRQRILAEICTGG